MEEELDRLAATMDAEVRAEQAEYEAMALHAQWRARSLSDVARELVERGDEVEIAIAGQTVTGVVVHAGTDHLVLQSGRGRGDVVLAAMGRLLVARAVRDGGRPAGGGARTLRARLTEHETAGTPLEVWLADGDVVSGVVGAAAADHLLLDTRRGAVVLPWASVAVVWVRAADG